MAEVIRYVDPDATGNADDTSWTDAYTSLNSWEAAEETDLVTDGDTHTVYCRSSSGTADTTAVMVDGWATGSGNWIKIEVPTDYRHNGKWDTSAYRIEASNTHVLHLNEKYCYVYGIQSCITSQNAHYQTALYLDERYEDAAYCILKGNNDASYRERTASITASGCKFYNNIVYNVNTTNTSIANAPLHVSISSTPNALIYNNILVGGRYSVYIYNNNVDCKNNIFYGAGAGVFSSGTPASEDYNATDQSSGLSGSHDRLSQTFTFVDEANDDYHLANTDTGAKDHGTDLSSYFTDDIDGDTRSGTWDIGADEYVSSGGGLSIDVNDTLTITESLTPLENLGDISRYDSMTINEMISALMSIRFNTNDTITVNELTNLIMSMGISVNDDITLTEAISILKDILISSIENISITEDTNVSLLGDNTISVYDNVGITEAISILKDMLISLYDSISISEDVSVSKEGGGINVYDTITLQEYTNIMLDVIFNIYDNVTVSEYISIAKDILASIHDTITVNEYVNVTMMLATGLVTVALSSAKPKASMAGYKPNINYTGNKPNISIT